MAPANIPLSKNALVAHASAPSIVGKPRFKALDKLLYEFYEALVLLKLIQPPSETNEIDLAADWGASEDPNSWHVFLDQLSWLCDSKHGGSTSSSIAVQALPSPKYWLAANSDPEKNALPHLRWVLGKLASLKDSSIDQAKLIQEELLRSCVEFSSDKIKNYCQRLRKAMKWVSERVDRSAPSPELELVDYLQPLQMKSQTHLELCNFASTCRKYNVLHEFGSKARKNKTDWPDVYHYIGRLGSWARATKMIVRFARLHSEVVEDFGVGFVPAQLPMTLPAADQKTTLESVLRRILSKNEDLVPLYLHTLRLIRSFSIDAWFTDLYQEEAFEPLAHAEGLQHEHFFVNGLEFFRGDKYVGSSKRSCYCCNLFYKYQESRITTRPTHGNLYHKWCIPPLPIPGGKLEWRAKRTLEKMRDHIQRDILKQIKAEAPQLPKVPDSTDGFWTIPSLRTLRLRRDMVSNRLIRDVHGMEKITEIDDADESTIGLRELEAPLIDL